MAVCRVVALRSVSRSAWLKALSPVLQGKKKMLTSAAMPTIGNKCSEWERLRQRGDLPFSQTRGHLGAQHEGAEDIEQWLRVHWAKAWVEKTQGLEGQVVCQKKGQEVAEGRMKQSRYSCLLNCRWPAAVTKPFCQAVTMPLYLQTPLTLMIFIRTPAAELPLSDPTYRTRLDTCLLMQAFPRV